MCLLNVLLKWNNRAASKEDTAQHEKLARGFRPRRRMWKEWTG
jgi:hypothetical protein